MFDILSIQIVSTPELPFLWCLSRNDGLHVHSIDDSGFILTCNQCEKSLYSKVIPLFSIPNWVFPERLPEIMKSNTIAENLLCSKVNKKLYKKIN